MLSRSEPARALSLVESITSPHPSWLPRMAMTRVVALATLDRPGEALTMLEPLLTDVDALASDERAWISSMQADLLLRSDQPEQALHALTDVQELALADDNLADWFLGLQARAATALNQRELLDAVLARMAERDAAVMPLAALVHTETLMLRNDLAGAFAVLRPLEEPRDATNPLAWVVAAQARLAADRADVEEALERAVELDPRSGANPIVLMTRAMVAARRGDLETVDGLYGAQAVTLDQRLLFHYLRAGALREAERLAEAIGELEAVEAEARHATSQVSLTLRAQALADKAVLLLRQDDLAGAERAVTQAEAVLATLPVGGGATPLTRMARGLLHMKREEHDEADKVLATAAVVAEAFPASAPVAFAVDYLRGVNWMLAGRDAAEDALRCLAAAVRRRPDDPDALDALGEVYLMVGEPTAALDAFTKALSLASGAGQTASLLRGKAAAQRRSGYLEAAVKSARDAASLEPEEARNWLSLGASQLELGRHDAAEIAFRRGWRLRPRPPDRVATQLLLGLTKALLDGDRAGDALEVLEEPLAGRLAEHEHLVQLNRAVALVRLHRHGEAIEALERAGRAETAEQLRAARSRRDSWLGFWFGAEVAPTRRRLGALLVVAAVLALVPVVVNPEKAGWLGWVAAGNIRPLVPLAAITLLFLLPVVTRIKLGDVEIEQPAAAAPTVTELQAVSWDAVERKVKSVSTVRIVPESTDALPRAEPAVAPPASVTVSSVTVVASQPHPASS